MEREVKKGGGTEGRGQFERRGKQAESPVRGKFTLVWWGEVVEESRDQCGRSQSDRRGAEVPRERGRVGERELHVSPVPGGEEDRAPAKQEEWRMKEMNKTYAIVEVFEGDQIQLVRRRCFCF